MTTPKVTDAEIRAARHFAQCEYPNHSDAQLADVVRTDLGISSSRYHAALRPKQTKPGYPAGKPRTYRLRKGCERLVDEWRAWFRPGTEAGIVANACADRLEALLHDTKG